MTLPVTARKDGPYNCNGSLQDFDFNFKVFSTSDIQVILTNSSGVETALVITTDYTVVLNTDQETSPGGTITTVATYATGNTITIIGALAYSQPTQLQNRSGFFPKVIERALDRLGILIQQLKEITDRSLTLPASVPSGVSTELPTPSPLGIVGWDASAERLVNYDANSLAGAVAAVDWRTDTFSGDGAEDTFILARDPGVPSNCDVSISGVTQVPGVDFTTSSTSIVFTSPPPAGTDNIAVRYGASLPSGGSVGVDGVNTVAIQDLAVTTAKLANNSVTVSKLASSLDLGSIA